MKRFHLLPAFAAVISIYSCNDQKTETHNAMAELPKTEDFKPRYADVKFTSTKDTTCGMPLGTSIADTLMFDGKVYGFCSVQCKHDFDSLLVAQHKR